jgi:hypothetical protein
MADDTSASIVHLHQAPRPKTPAERAKAYRDRKKKKQQAAAIGTAVTPAGDPPQPVAESPLPLSPHPSLPRTLRSIRSMRSSYRSPRSASAPSG